MVIRKAEREDCSSMMQLIQELAVYEKAPENVTVTLEHFRESGFGPNPVWWAFVAEEEGKLAGMALYYIRYSTWRGQMMYLEDIIITEAWRRNGIGSLLMESLFEEGKQKGYYGMTWQVLDWNEPAISFYKRYNAGLDAGWVNAMVCFQENNDGQ